MGGDCVGLYGADSTGGQTSATQFGALGPALQRPLVGVELRQQNVVVGDERQQVLVDDVFIGQAEFCVLHLGENLQRETDGGSGES